MKMYPFRVALGFLVVFLSIVLFLTTSRIVPWGIWLFVWQFWPMLLVIFGLAFLIRKWNLNFLIGTAIFILIFAAMGTGVWWTWKSQYFNTDKFAELNGSNVTEMSFSNELPKKIEKTDVRIIFGSSKMKIGAMSPDNNLLYSGTHNSNFFTMNERMEVIGEKTKLTLKTSPLVKKPFDSKGVNDLNLNFSPRPRYAFDITTEASNLDFDFQNLKVSHLDLDAAASDVNVRFGQNSNSNVEVKAGASVVRFYIPKDLGVKVNSKSTLVSNNFESYGLRKQENTYESLNYKSAKNKINIDLSAGISKVELISG